MQVVGVTGHDTVASLSGAEHDGGIYNITGTGNAAQLACGSRPAVVERDDLT